MDPTKIGKEAVLSAIAEYDRLGQSQFLSKYGFGRSRRYRLEYQGTSYESKAILGVAHKFQFPELGLMLSSGFSGGKEVAVKLRALGFTVRS